MIINWLAKMDGVLKEKSEYNVDARRVKNDIINVCLPVHEVNFWINRQENLQNIYNQLTTSTHKAVTEILEAINSTYCPPFRKIFEQLIYALKESREISIWLKPLLQQTVQFSSVHFNNAHHLIVPLVHVIHLIWSGAGYYKSTTRMATLLRCICNFLVCRAQEDLEVANLFNLDADEGLQKISKTLEILELFKLTMSQYKAKYSNNQTILPALSSLALEVTKDNNNSFPSRQLWHFSDVEVFGPTMDEFLDQLMQLREIFDVANLFLCLEKLEIGGSRGKTLTRMLKKIHSEFKIVFEELTISRLDFGQSVPQMGQQYFSNKS
uniref:Dynein heavy chain tail domain-containing protein n=1 Tax=Glossina austeni TaxID=7395 RepID=A0A1A9VM45_GLOAU